MFIYLLVDYLFTTFVKAQQQVFSLLIDVQAVWADTILLKYKIDYYLELNRNMYE